MHGRVRRRFARSVLLVLSVLALSFAALPLRADVSLPKRAPDRWVTDEAAMLSEPTRAGLDTRLQDYERKTGHQVVVWIGQTIGGAPLDDFAVKTFQAWQIGRKGHDDGVLMIVLARDRKIDIEVGYGLEGRLTDALSHRIIDEVMAPQLRAGQPDAAVSSGVDAILAGIEGRAFSGEPAVSPSTEPARQASPARMVLIGVLALLFLLVLATHPSLAMAFLFSVFNGGGGFGGGGSGGGGFRGGGGRSGGGGARGGW